MDLIRILMSRFTALFSKHKLDANLDDELRAHIEFAVEENRGRGMTEAEARSAALRKFGGFTQTKERYRMQRGLPFAETVGRDLRYALRQLRRSPGFTLTAVLTLAIGIGGVAAVYSVVEAVLLRPLPYRQPDQLVLVSETLPKMGLYEIGVSAAEYQDYRSQNRSFSQMAAYEGWGGTMEGFNLTGAGAPRHVNAAKLSASAFPLLGVSAEL